MRKNSIWTQRFSKQQSKMLEKFNSSLPFDITLTPYDIEINKAHAQMLAKQKIIKISEKNKIIKGLDQLALEFANGKHKPTTKHEDIHMFIEHLLIKKIGPVAKKLHTAKSRNDQVSTGTKMYCRDAVKEIKVLLNNLIKELRKQKNKHKNITMPSYTHLQQAEVIKLSLYFDAYIQKFGADSDRLSAWEKITTQSPMGAAAGNGSPFDIDKLFVAKKLGFSKIYDNTLDAISDRDYIIELQCHMSIIMVHLSRFCEDQIIWSSQEFDYTIIDEAFATGSSIMPNKKNPDVFELVRGKTGRVFGNLNSILTVMKGLPLSYNKDMQEDKESLFDSVETVVACLSVMIPMVKTLSFNKKLMHERSENHFINATQLVAKLVNKHNVKFRDAYGLVSQWILEASNGDGCIYEKFEDFLKKLKKTK